jgi:hypothetical protein
VHAVELAIDDPDGRSKRVELGGECEPGGAGAYHENADLLIKVSRLRVSFDRHGCTIPVRHGGWPERGSPTLGMSHQRVHQIVESAGEVLSLTTPQW